MVHEMHEMPEVAVAVVVEAPLLSLLVVEGEEELQCDQKAAAERVEEEELNYFALGLGQAAAEELAPEEEEEAVKHAQFETEVQVVVMEV